MFGSAALTTGTAVRDVLDAHVESANGRFQGIRFQANWDASSAIRNVARAVRPGMLAEPAVRAGLGVLAAMGLILDSDVSSRNCSRSPLWPTPCLA